MTYPLSTDVSTGQPTAAAHYNALRADALRLGQAEADSVKVAQFLNRYQSGIRLQYLATNRLRVPYVTTSPAGALTNLGALGFTADERHLPDHTVVKCQFNNAGSYFPPVDPEQLAQSIWDGPLTWETSFWR